MEYETKIKKSYELKETPKEDVGKYISSVKRGLLEGLLPGGCGGIC